MALEICELSEARFQSMADEWQRCLSASRADPLFMSWPWLYTWWETWSQILGLELLLLGVFDDRGTLVGIGPFYRRLLQTPIGLHVERIHFLGNAWRIAPTVRTEYCGMVLDQRHEEAGRRVLLQYLSSLEWDDLVICDVTATEQSALENAAQAEVIKIGQIVRLRDEGVRIPSSGDFASWLESLGRNTRLKLYNRRRYVREHGGYRLDEPVSAKEVEAYFDTLNRFHLQRWGKSAFDQQALFFHSRLLARLDPLAQPRLSRLWIGTELVSVLYDIDLGHTIYNLQSGYMEDFDPKLSLGTLHFGFAIEAAFGDTRCRYYDLLAGGGKKGLYKHRLKGEHINFYTVQLVKHSALRFIYRHQAHLPNRWRQAVNRVLRL